MKKPIKEKLVHTRHISLGSTNALGSIRHSIPRGNLEWARDLEEKSRSRISNRTRWRLREIRVNSVLYTGNSYAGKLPCKPRLHSRTELIDSNDLIEAFTSRVESCPKCVFHSHSGGACTFSITTVVLIRAKRHGEE